MTTYKDTDLREALRRMYADTPPMPEYLNERLMQRIGRHRRHAWLYPAIAVSIVIALLIGSSLFRTEENTNVCYTVENGQRITDRSIVMSHVESTLCDIFTTDKQ